MMDAKNGLDKAGGGKRAGDDTTCEIKDGKEKFLTNERPREVIRRQCQRIVRY
jgi:hypothetical protein